MTPQFLLAAPMSGSGKTTLARGLMALLADKGYRVQPFKCGPDYIDTKFHEAVCHRPSINLDTFMASPKHVTSLYERYAATADVCITEGMMGLYDGYDRDLGSSADIARVLDLPTVLVVDARSAAYSTAALIAGFAGFRQHVKMAGVIFNKVGSARHRELLRQVCDDLSVECLGFVPKSADLETDSRYLGLDFSQQAENRALVGLLEKELHWQRLLELTLRPRPQPVVGRSVFFADGTVAVARNQESFSFLYQENLDVLGPYLSFFDPEQDEPIPADTGLLYLPGGYPEKHLQALSSAVRCRESIRAYARRGGRILAECGGMMYLCRSILTDSGTYPMCGVLPYDITAREADRKLTLGYRRFVLPKSVWKGFILPEREYRGHEFHYTRFAGDEPVSAVAVTDAWGRRVPTPFLRWKNVRASYTHLYLGQADIERLFDVI